VTAGHFRRIKICAAGGLLAWAFAWTMLAAASLCWAQVPEPEGGITLRGHVHDAGGKPVANAAVSLQPASTTQMATQSSATTSDATTAPQTTHTDSEGAYRFAQLRAGAYTLHAELKVSADTAARSTSIVEVVLAFEETKSIDLILLPKESGKLSTTAPEFFDEAQFTVAGVTQATNSGGHGSDTVQRTTEALAKATISLNDSLSDSRSNETSASTPTSATDKGSSLDANTHAKEAESHRAQGDAQEKLGHPLEAVREYQRAAELDPSEPNLFDWGTELLTHRALEPATEVFTKSNRLFPKSMRMLVALGVTWYARGSYDEATQWLVKASDIAPDNLTPYLFLGKMQSAEAAPTQVSVDRFARFAEMQPDNALANYYYAVGLWKQLAVSAAGDSERSARVESLLLKAVHLDPKFGAAYLQLGILYSQREDFGQALSSYQKAVEFSSESDRALSDQAFSDQTLEEAHYRMAKIYQRTGDAAKAQVELQLYNGLNKKQKEDTERERRDIQDFVISLKNKASTPQP
jgi:tetratricopeptide (TPR) repeat protein